MSLAALASHSHFHPAPAWAHGVDRYPSCSMDLWSNNDSGHNVRCSFSHSHASRQRSRITIIVPLASPYTSETIELVAFAAAQVRETVASATTKMQPSRREIQDARSRVADVVVAYDWTLKPPSMTAEVRPRPINFDVLRNLFSTALVREYDHFVPMRIGGHCEQDLGPHSPTRILAPLMLAGWSIVKRGGSDEVTDLEREGVVHGAGKSAGSPGHDDAPLRRHDCVPKVFAPFRGQGSSARLAFTGLECATSVARQFSTTLLGSRVVT